MDTFSHSVIGFEIDRARVTKCYKWAYRSFIYLFLPKDKVEGSSAGLTVDLMRTDWIK